MSCGHTLNLAGVGFPHLELTKASTCTSRPVCTPVSTSATLPLPVCSQLVGSNLSVLPITVAPILASMFFSMEVTSCGAPTSALTPSLVSKFIPKLMRVTTEQSPNWDAQAIGQSLRGLAPGRVVRLHKREVSWSKPEAA